MFDKKRVVDLNKILRAFAADRIGSDEISDILILVLVDLNRIEILWWSSKQEANIIEDLLKTADEDLR
ncbi:unnamed protein product [Rotaria sordida]|uniref:Uncharacterized protein n=1 Tax=Rotaria sordida TaxID=392033 RepID=A0A819GKQ9_9BILA|nr:unnamed protein product [Rotaria sordida]